MALPQGIYFRASDNQTDPTDYDAEVGNGFNPTYPRTTPQGNVVGWEGANGNGRDRDATTDVRLKGVTFSSTQVDFRIDLPASGSHNIRAAVGDSGSAQSNDVDLLDTTTALRNIAASTSAGEWYDATGVSRVGESAWVANNAADPQTFSTTIFRLRLKGPGNSLIAALYIEAAAGGGPTPTGYLNLPLMGVG